MQEIGIFIKSNRYIVITHKQTRPQTLHASNEIDFKKSERMIHDATFASLQVT